jgi:hypothetical protein
MRRLPRFSLGPSLALALLLSGCASSEYAYVPAQAPTAEVGGRVAAEYPIPAQSPKGQLAVLSYGVVWAGTDTEPNARPALHVRLLVTNSSARPWSLDTREQEVTVAGQPATGVAFASASPGGAQPPVVDVAPGKSRTLDLFFPVPPDLDDDASAVPGFDLSWRLNTNEAIFVGATRFDRTRVAEEEEPAYVAGPYDYCPDYYWCGPYWYNPMYPYWGFGVVVVGPRWWGHHYYVHGGYVHGYYPHGGGYHGGFHGGGFHGGGFHGGGHHR